MQHQSCSPAEPAGLAEHLPWPRPAAADWAPDPRPQAPALTHCGHPSKVDTVNRDIMAESTLSKWNSLCVHSRGCSSICVGSPSLYS